jgi:hypothetical protein
MRRGCRLLEEARAVTASEVVAAIMAEARERLAAP